MLTHVNKDVFLVHLSSFVDKIQYFSMKIFIWLV